MPLSIASNIASLQAQRQLGKSSDALSSIYEQLSSGLRINHAADDAAGLAIASSLNADTRVYTQGIRNGNDAISYLNIADGALSNLSSITQRLSELGEQASNGSYSSSQRKALGNEATQLMKEYNRIISSTTFNGLHVIDGSNSTLLTQLGAGITESISATVGAGLDRTVGDGTFTLASSNGFSSGESHNYVDVNGDGIQDVIATSNNSGSGYVSVFLGNGDGTFKAKQTYAAGNTAEGDQPIARDFNGDGKVDLIIANLTNSNIVYLAGNGDGTFLAAKTINLPISGAFSSFNGGNLQAGDFNGDGKIDLVGGDNNVINIYYGNGDGTFKSGTTLQGASYFDNLAVGNFNGDGRDDITIINASRNLLTFSGNTDGTFSISTANNSYTGTIGGGSSQTIVGDINGDGINDIVAGYTSGTGFSVFIGNGDGTFKTGTSYNVGHAVGGITLSDNNYDGYKDVVISSNNQLITYNSSADGTLTAVATSSSGTVFSQLYSDSLSGDDISDIIGTSWVFGAQNIQSFNANTTNTNIQSRFLPTSFDVTSQADGLKLLRLASTVNDLLSSERGNIGATQSRIAVGLSNLGSRVENYKAAASSILDVDVASESSTLVSTQIRQQAGAAVLAQANQQPALVLKLLNA